ncbi:urease accessory protein [Nocardiopsis mwathae]|uniref:Urease accessory protein UreD n=1 Tax=Nocardiopsis mwathae TaxID=1472723 RepID=A0A7W9YER0_9ACTN|nr:urease accessory protein UreD [Nocardiopsis mwathae]MBB6170752.1 urease accessory protein [Nocardiopsis mwathae]
MSPTLTRDAARDHVSVHRPARIVVDAVDGRSRARVLEAGTFVSPRPMPGRGAGVKIALVGIRASLCAGDDFALRVEVGPGARVELVDPNGTVAFNARGGAASWRAELTLGEGAVVHWREQPFVLADGADVHREVRADLAPGAELLWRETLVLGRSGEHGGALRSLTRVTHGGHDLLVEDLDLRTPAARELPGILGTARVLGQVALFGRTPPGDPSPSRLDLVGAGALHRAVTHRAYETDRILDPVWSSWSDDRLR